MNERPWLPFAAAALVAALLAGAVATWAALAQALWIASAFALVCAALQFARTRRVNRYDLNELARVQERAELDAIELDEPKEYDSVRCLQCGTVYSDRLPVCPRCSGIK